jgi:ribosomal protein S18 acetylase RimI-like enzyme
LTRDIRIRPIARTDIPGLRAVLDAVARERTYLAFTEAPPLAEVRQYVLDHLKKKDIQLVAEAPSGTIVGWCDIIVPELAGFSHGGRLGMGVAKDLRRQGIGTRLMEESLGLSKRKGLVRIELDVFSSNISAICLYRRFGFVTEGRRTKARYLDGRFEDVEMMGLLL